MVFVPEAWMLKCEKSFSFLQIIHLLTRWVVRSPDLRRCPSLEVPPDSKSCLAVKSEDDWLLHLTSLYYFWRCILIVEIIWKKHLFCPGFSSRSQWCSSWEKNFSASVETTTGFLFAISHLQFLIYISSFLIFAISISWNDERTLHREISHFVILQCQGHGWASLVQVEIVKSQIW